MFKDKFDLFNLLWVVPPALYYIFNLFFNYGIHYKKDKDNSNAPIWINDDLAYFLMLLKIAASII
jgi:hypothetical protein